VFFVVVVGALVGISASGAAASDEPPVIVETGPVTVTSKKPATVHVTAINPMRVQVVGADVSVKCVSADTPEGICEPKQGFVELELSTSSSDAGSGTLVVADLETARSASVAVQIALVAASAAPPAKTTLPIEGCASWYSTHWFGCPDKGNAEADLDADLEAPAGSAVVSGAAGTGTVAVEDGASVATVASLDGFGESVGTLGSGDGALEVTVRRRAPLLFGFVVVLFGAFLASIVGWFAQWARAKSDGDIAQAKYKKLIEEASPKREHGNASLAADDLAAFARQWGLATNIGELSPEPLLPAEQRDKDAVDQFEKDLAGQEARWEKAEELIETKHEIDAIKPEQRLAWWIARMIKAGPDEDDFDEDYRWAQVARDYLHEANPSELDDLLGSATAADVKSALGAAGAPAGRRAAAPVAAEAAVGPARGRVEAVRGWVRNLAGVSNRVRITIVITTLVAVSGVLIGLTYSGATLLAVAFYAAALVGVPLASIRAGKVKKLPVLAAALVGTALATAFGGADALDASKGWGSIGDVVKTIGASFTVVGSLQLLRFGLPKVNEVTSS
jgi:hypothetical protein